MSSSSTATESPRRAHALLLTGGSAQSRMREAINHAAAVFCRDRRPDGTACGACAPCRKVLDDLHPDVLFLRPERQLIKVEAVRDIRRRLHLMPNEGDTRVVVIEDADTLNSHAQNALLAVLEEGLSVFFLLCETVGALLPTVLSRCALIRLPTEIEIVEARADVDRLLAAVRRRDDWQVMRLCYALGKMKRDEFTLVLEALSQALFEQLRHQLNPDKMEETGFSLTPMTLGRIIDECRVMRQRLLQNVGVAHLCGHLATLLTVDS